MPLLQLNQLSLQRESAGTKSLDPCVDIVAIHGLEENLIEAWTDPETKTLWLRDILARDLSIGRILTFGYNANATSFYGEGSADRIQQHAQTLVADLQADRSLEGCSARPIVFLCHGLGGILLKKALAYSSTRTSKNVQHLYSIFVSTYAILFFGTPHNGTDTSTWLAASHRRPISTKFRPQEGSQLLKAIEKDCETLQGITEQFNHLMKQFHIFFFWEEIETDVAGRKCYVVEESSAAPILDHTERAGIYANHAQMIRFSNSKGSSYRTVSEAIRRYCVSAPPVIARRWQHAVDSLTAARSNEAFELAGLAFDVHNDGRPYHFERKISEKPRNRYFRIPQAVSSIFTGREDVTENVEQAFWAINNDRDPMQQKRYIIYGIGGSGKTQFCSKFAQDHRERFWGVFWVDATSAETAKSSFSAIGKLGGMEATQSAGKHWLSNAEEPWLLIINNADEPSLDIASLFPDGERGHVMVTTRNPHFRTHGTVGTKEFKGLEEKDAVHLLLRAADTPKPWDCDTEILGHEIADALGYLALALIQAGALILQRMCDMRDYLNFYRQYRQRFRSRRISVDSEVGDQSAVYATYEHSLDSLQSRKSEAGLDAIQLLSIVAFFHFEHIRVDIFTRALCNTVGSSALNRRTSFKERIANCVRIRLQPPPTLPDFLRHSCTDSYRIRRALHELSSFSLISYDGKDDSFSLHPVVHAWARDRLAKQGQQQLWAQIAINVLSRSIMLPPGDVGELHEEYRRDILIHLDLCLQANPIKIMDYHSAFGSFRLPLALSVHYAWLFVFQDQVLTTAKFGYVYLERGRFDAAAHLLGDVKDALISSRGYKDEKTMKAMLALAGTYWGLGRLEEAIELQKKVIESRKSSYGALHQDTLSSMDQLGRSYWLNGQYKEALDLQTETVEQMKQVHGSKHEATLTAMDNLGVTYGSWEKFCESRDIHNLVLQVRSRSLGPSDLETLNAMNNKAMALKDLGILEEAKLLMVEVHKQRQRKLGKEHPWTLWAICNLAKVNCELGLLKEAENLLISGIAAGKRSLGDDHLGVLMGTGELARVYFRQKRWQEATNLIEDLVPRLEHSRGTDHPDTVFVMHKLALVYKVQKRTEEAIRVCQLAARRSRLRLPDEHPLVRKIAAQLQELTAPPNAHSNDSIIEFDKSKPENQTPCRSIPKRQSIFPNQLLKHGKTF